MIELEEQQELGRAKNAIQEYLIRKLLIPKIYLDADWDGVHVDVLAIDRAGVGDVHLVRVLPGRPHLVPRQDDELTVFAQDETTVGFLEDLKAVPGHFRYVVGLARGLGSAEFHVASALLRKTFAPDGVGRVGILLVDLQQDEAAVKTVLKPERFRSSPEIIKLTDQFVAGHTANWEIRDEPASIS